MSFRPLAGFWFLNEEEFLCTRILNISFRPIAGFWFLNGSRRHRSRVQRLVSVPLRGSGS